MAKFVTNILKDALGLSEEDLVQFQQYIQQLKSEGPALVKRAELSEIRTNVIFKTLEKVYPDQFAAAKTEVIEQRKAAEARRQKAEAECKE